MKRTRQTPAQVFALPLLIGFATIAGLVLGLTGDDARDLAAALLAGIAPLAIIAVLARRT